LEGTDTGNSQAMTINSKVVPLHEDVSHQHMMKFCIDKKMVAIKIADYRTAVLIQQANSMYNVLPQYLCCNEQFPRH